METIKKDLLTTNLNILKDEIGDNITDNDIANELATSLHLATGLDFDVSGKYITFNYKGVKNDILLEIVIHYTDMDKASIEVMRDIVYKASNDVETTIVEFGLMLSVVDMFVSDTLNYFGK